VYILHKEGSECALPGLYADSALKINTSDLPVMGGAQKTPNEPSPALIMGLTVQPCGELRCSVVAGFFKNFPF